MSDWIKMQKGAEEKLVHPGNVHNHERAGWTRVSPFEAPSDTPALKEPEQEPAPAEEVDEPVQPAESPEVKDEPVEPEEPPEALPPVEPVEPPVAKRKRTKKAQP